MQAKYESEGRTNNNRPTGKIPHRRIIEKGYCGKKAHS